MNLALMYICMDNVPSYRGLSLVVGMRPDKLGPYYGENTYYGASLQLMQSIEDTADTLKFGIIPRYN